MNHKIFQNVLVLSPHTDDGELAAGGTMARFIEEGVAKEDLDALTEECARRLSQIEKRQF